GPPRSAVVLSRVTEDRVMRTYLNPAITVVLTLLATAVAHAREERIKLSDPSGTHVINHIDGRHHFVIKAQIGRLEVKGKIDGQSILDCSHLEAGEIIIEGGIDGQSHVELRAKGTVKIGGGIVGQSQVEIHEAADVFIGGAVDGQS